jgi:hypothetical protein
MLDGETVGGKGNVPVVIPALDYADRQKIVVVDDEAAYEARRAVLERTDQDVPSKALALTTVTPGGVIAALGVALVTAGFEHWMEARKAGVNILPVARSEAAAHLKLPPGHPLPDVLYVGDPVAATRYYPAAEFHYQTFLNKFEEMITLLDYLGAAEIKAYSKRGWSRDIGGELGLPIPDTPVTVDATARESRTTKSTLVYHDELVPSTPREPQGLLWLPHETSWQRLVDRRMSGRAKKHTVKVSYSQDYGISAKLAAKVQGLKIGLGGNFKEHVDTDWSVEVRFEAAA